ncbi:MAG: hypothetical protein QF595_13625 [Dehalococcoidia bacterium]|jgi:hypothetical protein|nr:hypothetical protein [Dehalococcoidia bacterium]
MSNPRAISVISFLFATSLPILIILGCSSNSEAADSKSSVAKIENIDRILTIEDLENAGWKRGKTYDVNGLTGAKAAYVGFWAPPGLNNLNYEIRVYPDHKSAVEQGAPFAEDASGANASLSSGDALWSEGVRDRRMIVGGGSRGSQNPRYGDYMIFGNLVILCEGRTSEHALEQCAPLISLLRGNGA